MLMISFRVIDGQKHILMTMLDEQVTKQAINYV